MYRHVIGIHLDAWLGHQDESPAPDLRLDLQCRAGDYRVGEVELHGPADRAYLHPLRDHPPAAPRGIPALIVEPDDVLSPRRAPAHMAGHLGKVSRQRRQLAARAGRQGRAQALVKLGLGQPPVASGHTEDLDHPVPVLIRGPQLRLIASTRTSCRREIIARHGHILQDIAAARNLGRTHTTPPQQHGGTIYNTVLYFSPDGALAGRHRKLVPTGSERTVWGMGDGSTLRVVDTPFGRLGGLICWENYMPLARFHMYAQGVDLWIAPTRPS